MVIKSNPHQPPIRAGSCENASSGGRQRIAHALEMLALCIVLMVVGMRPLLSEVYDAGLHAIGQAAEAPETITPATTAFFCLAIWLAALATAIAAGLQRIRWRWSGLEIGWVVFLIAAVVSTITAGNQRLAISASSDWLTAIALLALVAHLCRDRFRIALVLSVLVASGVTSAAKSGMQTYIEFAETQELYNQNKETFWQRQGVPLDDPQVELFERRMAAREATGFFPHSNAQGAWLSLAGFAALAAAGGHLRKERRSMVLVLVAALLLASIFMTGSTGALVAMVIGLGLWFLLDWACDRLRGNWEEFLIVAWLAVVTATAGVVMYSKAHGGLPNASLNFRWQYWQVTERIIRDHLWTGVGALNFDQAYLLHKPVTYPEEIKDPHNFVLSILSQWGILGGVGLALVMIGATVVLARRLGRSNEQETLNSDEPEGVAVPIRGWFLVGVIGYVLLRSWLLRELLDYPAGGALLWFDLGFHGLVWGLTFVGVLWLARTTLQSQSVEYKAYRLPLLAGVTAFLLHNTIDTSLFFAGTLTPFMAMGGLLLVRPQRAMPASASIGRQWGMAAVVTAAMIGVLVFHVIPVSRSMRLLSLARREPLGSAIISYKAAAEADPFDPTPLIELAGIHAGTGGLDAIDQAVQALDAAIRRDPHNIALHQKRAMLLEMRYQKSGLQVDLLGAMGAARQCVLLYPASPDRHLDLADLLNRTAKELDTPGLLVDAIEHYRRAIALNDARPGTDEVRRWSADYRQQVLERLNAAESLAAASAK